MSGFWDDEEGNDFGWRCPKCRTKGRLSVYASLWVMCVKGGTIPNGRASPNHDHEWGDDSMTYCRNCEEFFTAAEMERAGQVRRAVIKVGDRWALAWLRPKKENAE